MATLFVDKLDPQSGTTLTLGSSGDNIVVPTGATLDLTNSTVTGLPASGKVLQVVSFTSSTEVTSSSASYVTTGLEVSITPSSASSKIFIIANTQGYTDASGVRSYTFQRDATVLGTNPMCYLIAGSPIRSMPTFSFLDSPSSTSSLTYKMVMKSSGGSAYAQEGNNTGSITVWEIAG